MRTLDEDQAQSPDQLSNNAFEYIRTTAPWMKLAGIAGILFSSLYALVGIFIMVAFKVALGIVFLVIGVLYILFTLLLLQSGISFSAYVRERNILLFERGLKKQRLFWIITGVVVILSFLIIVLALITGGPAYLNMLQQLQQASGS